MKLDATLLMKALGLSKSEIPVAVILEGSWWQQQRNKLRLSQLESVRELPFPEMHLGYYHDKPVLYSCVYGAPRAVEPVHIFGSLGTSLAIMIGSCGAIQHNVHTGDIVLPSDVRIGEGASQYYASGHWSQPSAEWVRRADENLRTKGFSTHRGRFITTSALFAQPKERTALWEQEGYLGVDMETSAVFSVAKVMGMDAVSMVFAWDELYLQRTFLDEFSAQEKAQQERANLAIYEVALDLAIQAEVRL
jgi:purine-nucleoside phosphorylase